MESTDPAERRRERSPTLVGQSAEHGAAVECGSSPSAADQRPAGGLLLRGGAVRWRGCALLLTGADGAGTSRLGAALVRAGAELISDGAVRLDQAGHVLVPHGAPAAAAAGSRIDLALIVSTTYQAGARWKPSERHGLRAVLSILDRTTAASGSLLGQLRLAACLAPRVSALSGPRPDADRVAPAILAYLDALIDGGAPGRVDDGPTQLAERAATALSSAALEPAAGAASPEVVRALLLQQPSVVMLYWHGRFGNRMHQYAYGATYARLNGCRFWLPSQWEGTHLFASQPHAVLPQGRLRATLHRSKDQFDRPERRIAALREAVPEAVVLRPADPRENYAARHVTVCFDNMCTYHPSIFSGMSRAHLRALFTFSDAVQQLELYKRLEDRQGSYDIAHLRRDDISNPAYNQTHVQGYSVISKRSYDATFAKFGFDPAAIEWVSDDYSGTWHTDRVAKPRGRWRYPTGSEVLPEVLFDWLEDFLRLYFARTIFRANSSFSWWAAFLSPGARVFSPVVDKRHIYGVDGLEELDVDFVEGNHPHWMSHNADIRIGA